MFGFFGGATKLLVPDNLKSGVDKASFYDPEINGTYLAMAAHYSVGILPARQGKSRDKAKGEAGVTQGQRRRAEPDWAALARELKRPGVTMTILWEEYREVHPEGYGYSRFCDPRARVRLIARLGADGTVCAVP